MPPPLVDPSRLHRTAARIRSEAEALRQRAGLTVAAAAAIRWRGPAAEAFHHRVQALGSSWRRAAERLEQAASDLDRHADQAGARAHEIAVAGAAVTAVTAGVGADAVAGAVRLGHDALGMLGL